MADINEAKEMREAGNLAVRENEFEKAIKIYSDALLTVDLLNEDKVLLLSNRSHAYLKCAMKTGADVNENHRLALRDAEEVIKMRPTWWKGYFRVGQVHQFKSEWKMAIDFYDQALALNPDLEEVANYRDECRYDQSLLEIQAPINSECMARGLKEQIDIINKERGFNLEADTITKKYEKLMKSKDPKERVAACLFFGDLYVQGVDVPQDLEKGAELFQEAAGAGSPEAMGALGTLYMEGKGVPRNIRKAVTLFETAAKCEPKEDEGSSVLGIPNYGITHAHFQIGRCYQFGTGKPLDYFQACESYKKASDGGHAGAANNLGILYHSGRGVEKNLVRARQYWSLAASRGNVLAMDTLAWDYLRENEFEQAQSWYTRALEAENINSILHKEDFYAALEKAQKGIKELEKLFPKLSTSDQNVTTELKSRMSREIVNLIEACERIAKHETSVTSCRTLANSPLEKHWAHLDEIKKRAKDGHPFAQTLLKAMGYFAQGIGHLKSICSKKIKSEEGEDLRELCIYNLANCFRATEIVAFFEPSQLPELIKLCKANITNQRSDLDLAARVVYCCVLSASQSSEIIAFSKISCQKYPDELFFYKISAGALAVSQNFGASLKSSEEGLKRFHNHPCLLYCKAGAMKMLGKPEKEVIAAYKEFIKEAPFDERMIPEAYYNIAFHSLSKKDKLAEMYYAKGLEEEKKLLPCFFPNESNVKNILEAFLKFGQGQSENVQSSKVTKPVQKSGQPPEASSDDLQVTNPARLQFVQRHRETLKKMSELHSQNVVTNLSVKPQLDQQMPKNLKNITEITFRDMNSRKDQVYTKRIINLLISEDPMFELFSAVHVVVRDDNGDCLNCSFYELDHKDAAVRRNLCFGSKISVLNPYYRLAGDGSVVLRVDDPNTIIYQSSGKDNPICRYCWKENPEHACSHCKRVKYCSKDCQIQDWKVLKHKFICDLKYLKNF